MASYQPTILPAPPQYGFLPGLASGIASGSEKFSNAYGEAAVKDIFAKKETKRKQEAMTKFQAAMQQDPSMELDQTSVDENGNLKVTFKKKKTPENVFSEDPVKAIKQAMLGVGTEDVGRTLGIQPQQPMASEKMNAYAQAMGSPGIDMVPYGMSTLSKPPLSMPMSMITPRNTQGGRLEDYDTTVKRSLMNQFAPGYTPEQVNRDIMGLPIETPQEKSESDFQTMAKQAVAGQITWDYLKAQYPDKISLINKMQPQLTPVSKAEGFIEGTGTPVSHVKSFLSESQAELSEETKTVIANIKTQSDLDELLKNADDYEANGVDVKAILEYFGVNAGVK